MMKERRWYFCPLEQPDKTFGIAGILWLIKTSDHAYKTVFISWKKENNKSGSLKEQTEECSPIFMTHDYEQE